MGTLTVVLASLTVAMLALTILVSLGVEPKDVTGRVPVAHDTNIPEVSLTIAAIAAAAGLFVGLAALHAAASMRVLARDRRIPAPVPSELRGLRALVVALLAPFSAQLVKEPAPPPTRLLEEGSADGPLRLTVLVPAHNESVTIAATLDSLWAQTRSPDRVVVVADNCNDDTVEIAERHGADVFTTVGNRERKAGALNQALSEMFAHAAATTSR